MSSTSPTEAASPPVLYSFRQQVPLELARVFTALWLAHQSFSTVSLLGIIVLTSIDITTAVLLIDMGMK